MPVPRDGTYLVGTSCILTAKDTKILFCGGLYKLRTETPDELNPFIETATLRLLTQPLEPFDVWDDIAQYTTRIGSTILQGSKSGRPAKAARS